MQTTFFKPFHLYKITILIVFYFWNKAILLGKKKKSMKSLNFLSPREPVQIRTPELACSRIVDGKIATQGGLGVQGRLSYTKFAHQALTSYSRDHNQGGGGGGQVIQVCFKL